MVRYPGLGLQKGKARQWAPQPIPSILTISATAAQKTVTVQSWGTPAPQQHPWCSLPQAGVGSAASPHCCCLQLSAPHSGWLHPEMSQGSSIQSHFCPSVNPRLSIIDFCLLLRPRHLQDSREVSAHGPARGPHRSGVNGDSSPRKHQPWQRAPCAHAAKVSPESIATPRYMLQ